MKYQLLIGAVLGAALTGAIAAGSANAVEYKIVEDTVPQSLTGKPGDPANGKKTAINRRKGNCLACHDMPIPEQADHGQVGPPLLGVGSRLSEAELRMRVIDSKVINPDTIMPAFYRSTGLHRVLKKWQGKTIVSAQEVEDIVAYLMTLKE